MRMKTLMWKTGKMNRSEIQKTTSTAAAASTADETTGKSGASSFFLRLVQCYGLPNCSSWRTLEDFSMDLSSTSTGKSSESEESLAFRRSMKDSMLP